MERFILYIQKHKKAVIGMIFLVTVFCVFMRGKLQIGYDWSEYLPEDADSVAAKRILQQEYGDDFPNLEIQIENVTVPKALMYKQQIREVHGVQTVFWLDDVINIYEPLEFQDQDRVSLWYQNQTAVLRVAVEENDAEKTIEDLRQIIGSKGTVTGKLAEAVDQAVDFDRGLQSAELLIYSAFAVLLVLFSDSWGSGILIFLTVMLSGLINTGADVLFGELFYLTRAVEVMVQIPFAAVFASDYLRFVEHKIGIRKPLMEAAILIFCSLSLPAMRFGLGAELALVLVKTAAVTVLTVVLFVPAWNAWLHGWIRRTKHSLPDVNLRAFSRTVFSMRYVILILLVPVFLVSFLAQRQVGTRIPEGKSYAMILIVPSADQAFGSTEQEQALNKELSTLKGVSGVVSYSNNVGIAHPEEYLEETERGQYYSENCSRFFIIPDKTSDRQNTVNAVKMVAEKHYGEYFFLSGEVVEAAEIELLSEIDRKSLMIILTAVLLILFLMVSKSVLLAVIGLLMIYGAIWINLAFLYFAGYEIQILTMAPSCFLLVVISAGTVLEVAHLYLESRKMNMRRKTMKSATENGIRKIFLPCMWMLVSMGITGSCVMNEAVREVGILAVRQTVISGILTTVAYPLFMMWLDRGIELTSYHPVFLRKGNGKSES